MNIPKHMVKDLPLFYSILNDLFTKIKLDKADNDGIDKSIILAMTGKKFQIEEGLFAKLIQSKESMNTRHSSMLVGQSGSWKITSWQTLWRIRHAFRKIH
jgi:dynein heavy chain